MAFVHGIETDYGAAEPAATYRVNDIRIRFTDNEYRALTRIAKARGKSINKTAQSIVIEYLAELGSHIRFNDR